MESNITVVITIHEKYLQYLDDCLSSIQSQKVQPKEIIIIADKTSIPIHYQNNCTIINVNNGTPNPGRNIGLQMSKTEWTIFFDADDIMGPDYIEGAIEQIQKCQNNVGVIYPNLYYFYHNKDNDIVKKVNAPDWGYWKLREGNYIDTSSIWKTKALLEIGGWDDIGIDDYGIALKLSRNGWVGNPLPENYYIKKRKHEGGRFVEVYNSPEYIKSLWESRTFSILTLMAGRENYLDNFAQWIEKAILPPNISIFIVDNSNNINFSRKLQNIIPNNRFCDINYHFNNTIYNPELQKRYYDPYMHSHVANIYNEIFQFIKSDFILTFEDDIIPPLDGIKQLHDHIVSPTKIGAIGASYILSQKNKDIITASLNKTNWKFNIHTNQLNKGVKDVGFIGGGFTLWSNFAVQKCLPLYIEYGKDFLHGWDYNLCKDIRMNGYEIKLDTNLQCDHLKERINF